MNIKKLTALLCAVVMVLSLAACGSGDKAENKHYTVGICQLVQHDALDAATKGFRDAITDALGAENVTFDEQIGDVEQAERDVHAQRHPLHRRKPRHEPRAGHQHRRHEGARPVP